MSFQYPWAYAFLTFIPFVILLYMLKSKYQSHTVSSIYLWEKVLLDINSNTPWQKLRRNLLLFLQLLCIILFIFALSNPMIKAKDQIANHLIIVLDNSGSMNTKYKDTNRFLKAKKDIKELIQKSSEKTKITLITCGGSINSITSSNDKKHEVLSLLDKVENSNSKSSMIDAISLADAVKRQDASSIIYIYTDTKIPQMNTLNANIISFSTKVSNVSLDFISNEIYDDKIHVLVRATNRSDVNITREIALFAEDKLIGLKNVDFLPHETKSLYFDGDYQDFSYIYAEISQNDDLFEDNRIYDIVEQNRTKKILLLTNNNIFLDKAITLIDGVELYKTNNIDSITEGYDLYIFDDISPKDFQYTGNLLIFKKGESEGGIGDLGNHKLAEHILDTSFVVSKYEKIDLPNWAHEVAKINGDTLIYIGEKDSIRQAVFGFDLHDSDFSLLPQFPIFINNLIAYLTKDTMSIETSYTCGDTVYLKNNKDSKAFVITPSGEKTEYFDEASIYPIKDTKQIGIYSTSNGPIAINFPSDSESVQTESFQKSESEVLDNTKIYTKSIGVLFIFLLIIIVGLEWMVYILGY